MGQQNCKILDCSAGCCNKAGICPVEPYSLGGPDKCEYFYNRTLAIYICIPLAFLVVIVLIIATCCYFRGRTKTKSKYSRDSSSTMSSDKNQENNNQKDQKDQKDKEGAKKVKEGFQVERRDSSNGLIYHQGVIEIQSDKDLVTNDKQNIKEKLTECIPEAGVEQKFSIN